MWLWGDRQSGSLELSKKGTDKRNIIIVDLAESCVQSAASSGYIALLGDPTHKNILIDAGIKKASNVIICLVRRIDALSILNTRNLNGNAKIIACVNNSENFKLMRQAKQMLQFNLPKLEVIY